MFSDATTGAAPSTQGGGPTSAELLARYSSTLLPLFAPTRVLAGGDGVFVTDVEGRRYLDLLGGIAVNALGHNHSALVKAASEQAARAIHISNFFASPQQIELASTLLRLSKAPEASGVFFTNSGTESNEAAFKIARRTGKPRVLALDHSFHGRTMGALALTAKEQYRAPFEPLPGGVEFIEAGNVEELEKALSPGDVAAVFAEPIQGEAGVRPLGAGYLRALRELTREYGALLVVDEVQTGVGRTGEWFAHQAAGIVPDVMTLAKGLGGGYPIGAVVTFGEQPSALLQSGQHGTTFGGNPLGAAMALAVVETIESEGLLAHVRETGDEIRAALRTLDCVRDVRGEGLLIGVDLAAPVAKAVVAEAMEKGVIVNATGESTLRLAPPLIVTAQEVEGFVQMLPDLVHHAGAEGGAS